MGPSPLSYRNHEDEKGTFTTGLMVRKKTQCFTSDVYPFQMSFLESNGLKKLHTFSRLFVCYTLYQVLVFLQLPNLYALSLFIIINASTYDGFARSYCKQKNINFSPLDVLILYNPKGRYERF